MEDFIKSLSIDRLKSYEILCPNKENMDIIGAYHWNLLISQTLYPFIHSIEIALRNSIHQAASQKFENEFWFENVVINRKNLANYCERFTRYVDLTCFNDCIL